MEHIIKIKEGYGDLSFRMPIEEAVKLLGEPDSIEGMENAMDEPTTVVHYDDYGLTLFFEGTVPVLECIDLSYEESTLFGKKIFDMNEREIVRLMVANEYYEQDVDNESWGERRISFGEGNIDFFFEKDVLQSVIYGE